MFDMLLSAWAMQEAVDVGWGFNPTREVVASAESAWVTSNPPYQAGVAESNKKYDRATLAGATWPGNTVAYKKLGESTCRKLRGEDGKGWSYESECRVSKILRMPELGELKHICNDDYEYIPNGKLGHDKFIVLVESTDGRKAIVTMMIEVYEETGQFDIPSASSYLVADYSLVGWVL